MLVRIRVEKEPLYTAGGNDFGNDFGKQYGGFLKN
jgi:hypothetical protein